MLVALQAPFRFERFSNEDLSFLERRFTPRTVFMEIGAADCSFALRAASNVERVYAIDISGRLLRNVLMPCNLRLVRCDGVRIPVPEAAVDVAWSGTFMDQLRATDAFEHLKNVARALTSGGQYFCSTQSCPLELRSRLLAAGFSAVRCYLGAAPLPWAVHSLVPRKLLRIAAIK